MKKIEAIVQYIMIITVMVMVLTCCEFPAFQQQEPFTDPADPPPTEDCQPVMIGGLTYSNDWKGMKFYHYGIQQSEFLQCGFFFIEAFDFGHLVDSVELVRFEFQNVGAAYWLVDDILPTSGDSSLFVLLQYRETFLGEYNNNAICNGGNIPDQIYGYTRFKACSDYAVNGDKFGLRKREQ